MAPTICSGKKRESRTLINSSIRRNGQGSHQLNQTLSNIVNYVAKGSLNASLRIKAHNQTDKNVANNTKEANLRQRQQQFSFLSDNAVTSSRHSDTENSIDLRLANETLINDATPTYSANTNSTSLSTPSSLSSSVTETAILKNERTSSSSTSPYEERRFCRYSSINTNSSDNDATDLFKENREEGKHSPIVKGEAKHLHSGNIRKTYYDCKDFDSEEDESQIDMMSGGSDTDMDADESDSMTSLDTEKSAKLKISNNPLLRDKLLVRRQQHQQQQQADKGVGNSKTDDNRKNLTSISSSTDGLLSIAIKTIKLVKRNQLLQQRLTQLQMETSEFIQSVLANPENRHFRENMKQCKRQVDNI